MKRYWDASALIDAIHDSRVEAKAQEPGQVTRVHTLAEVFSTLTGGRLGFQYLADDAAEWPAVARNDLFDGCPCYVLERDCSLDLRGGSSIADKASPGEVGEKCRKPFTCTLPLSGCKS